MELSEWVNTDWQLKPHMQINQLVPEVYEEKGTVHTDEVGLSSPPSHSEFSWHHSSIFWPNHSIKTSTSYTISKIQYPMGIYVYSLPYIDLYILMFLNLFTLMY